MQALGAQLLDKQGQPIPYGGGNLAQLHTIDIFPVHELLNGVQIEILCDVDNPLLGENGAANIFAPQKGADEQGVTVLEQNLTHYAKVIKRDCGIDLATIPSTGAAGGLSAGLLLVGGELVSGASAIIRACGYHDILASGEIDLVITGEGKLDNQTKGGKAPFAIAQVALQYDIPCGRICRCGNCRRKRIASMGIQSAWSIIPYADCTLETAYENAATWLIETAINFGNTLTLGRINVD